MWFNRLKYCAVLRRFHAILVTILVVSLVGLTGTSYGAEPPTPKQPSVKSAKPRLPLKSAPSAQPGRSFKRAPQTYRYTAYLEESTQRQGTVAVAGVKWECKGRRCMAQMHRPTLQVDACRALAKLVGKVHAYGHGSMKLNRHQLKQCNASVSKVTTTNVTRKHAAPRPKTSVSRRVPHTPAPKMEVRGARRTLPLWHVPESRIRASAARVLPKPRVISQGDDCNDRDPNIHPNQPESRCDGVDDNCNGEIDEGLRITAYRDRDHDLFGDPESGFLACPQDVVGELTNNNFDCDDNNPRVNPSAGNCP